jgi:hypothetical protein
MLRSKRLWAGLIGVLGSVRAASANDATVAQQTTAAECGLPPSLVARGWQRDLSPTAVREPEPFVPGSETLAVLPDTQYYAMCNSPHFERQTRWVARAARGRAIRAVITLGDLTESNTEAEWSFVQQGFLPLEERLPLVLVTGNHDHGDSGQANQRRSLFTRYFAEPQGASAEALTETLNPGDRENAYYRVRLPKVTLGVLALEWSPRDKTVAWANDVVKRHAQDRIIVVTHAYLYHDGTRYDWWGKGEKQEWNPCVYRTARRDPSAPTTHKNIHPEGAHDGEALWRALVSQHPNIFLTLNGHVLGDGSARLSSRGVHGNLVQQVLVNFQMLREGGLGYLRLLEVLPDGKTLRMKTYSPSLGVFATAAEQTGDLELSPPLW